MLGVLGLGSKSTLWYVDQLNLEFNKKNGGYSTCPFIMLNANFNNINPYLPDNFEHLIPAITKLLNQLLDLGAKKILVPNITLHQAIEQINPIEFDQTKIISPFSIFENQKELILSKPNYILGTKYMINSNYIAQKIKNLGGKVKKLDENQQLIIDELRTRIYSNGSNQNDEKIYAEILDKIGNKNVFVSCTELSLLSPKNNVFNLSSEQISEAINFC